VALAAGLGWVYSVGQKKDAELAALREESQQLQKLQADLEETKNVRAQAESDELARLRKDHEELLRLRNEVRQLRADKQQLTTQAQTAQAQAQSVQQQMQALAQNPKQAPAQLQLNPAAQTAMCINNLRRIDAAKLQWALENQKPAGALLTAADLAPYLRTNTLPACPAGGVYTLNQIGLAPICNIPGHTLSK